MGCDGPAGSIAPAHKLTQDGEAKTEASHTYFPRGKSNLDNLCVNPLVQCLGIILLSFIAGKFNFVSGVETLEPFVIMALLYFASKANYTWKFLAILLTICTPAFAQSTEIQDKSATPAKIMLYLIAMAVICILGKKLNHSVDRCQ